ncbi:MAG: formyltransferase family protein [Leptospira sp.]|nr:formyltransferase family protein [Leptospira sp.]
MRILFIGSVQFSESALLKLIQLKAEIVGIISKEKAGINSDYVDLSKLAGEIPFMYTENINDERTVSWVKGIKPDIIFCFGWSSLIKNEILKIPRMGIVGFHPAELPFNRGRHPIIWALALGLENTASTFFFMDEGADSGDILSQKKILIDYKDDAESLYKKITETALNQINDFLPKLQTNTYNKISQDHRLANTWRKRGKIDGKIDFRMSSYSIYNLVRALTKPYVGAHIEYLGKEFKIWKVSEISFHQKNVEPGKIIEILDGKVIVKTGDTAIQIEDHQILETLEIGNYLL